MESTTAGDDPVVRGLRHNLRTGSLLFAIWFLPRLLFEKNRTPGGLAESAVVALTFAGTFVLMWSLARRAARRKTGSDEYCQAAWRTYRDGRPTKWRSGWLRRAAGVVAAMPDSGRQSGPKLVPAAVCEVRERPARGWRETSPFLADARVLELTLDGTRVDILVSAPDVPDLRRWLTRT